MNLKIRKVTFFEKILLFTGIALCVLGFYLINTIFEANGRLLSFEMLNVVFSWVILLFLVIVAAIAENQREESRLIDQELHEETRLMRELIKDQLLEIKYLREDLFELKKIEHDLEPNKKVKKTSKKTKLKK